ncbi:hypothetical protein BJP36_18430 [Moorena producens JHB]|uniref:Uncharacterized protein n=1 Tax=Moorena producens (strain JHB) TaxID=1454205 RepID=A0A1D9G1V0_MOOP1|nr:hypothetical protein [Moorena producens]AOY81598.1 hypothetical protein BJP36_18430 [Moorena producens JHB]
MLPTLPIPDSLGALSVGELNSPRVAPLPIPDSRFPVVYNIIQDCYNKNRLILGEHLSVKGLLGLGSSTNISIIIVTAFFITMGYTGLFTRSSVPYSVLFSPLIKARACFQSFPQDGYDPPQPPLIRGEPYSKSPFFKGDLGGSPRQEDTP